MLIIHLQLIQIQIMALTGLHDVTLRNSTNFLSDNKEMDIREGYEMAGSFHKRTVSFEVLFRHLPEKP
jgi:hypothetical protein